MSRKLKRIVGIFEAEDTAEDQGGKKARPLILNHGYFLAIPLSCHFLFIFVFMVKT